MAISATATVFLLSTTGLGVWAGWKIINRTTLAKMEEEAGEISKQPIPGTGKMRKFLLGSKKFGFYYAYAESHVRFEHMGANGARTECVFPVSALRTPAAAALIAAVFTAAQAPVPSGTQMAHFVQEVQTTISVVPVGTANTGDGKTTA